MVPSSKNRRKEDVDDDCCCVGCPCFDLGQELQIPSYGHVFAHWGMLGKIAYPFLFLPRFLEDVEPGSGHRSFGSGQEPGDYPHGGGFAGPASLVVSCLTPNYVYQGDEALLQ